MLSLPSRNVGCHLLPLRQLPVPPSAATVGRVRHSAPTKFETVSNAVKTTNSNPKCESYWFLRNRQACRRLSTVIAATLAGCSATTCRSSIIQFSSKPCCRCKTVGVLSENPNSYPAAPSKHTGNIFDSFSGTAGVPSPPTLSGIRSVN